MRLVDVHVDAERPLDLVLHPRLTVITGDPVAGSRLAEVLSRAFALAGTDIKGTVDYSGFHTPLDQIGVVSLDLPGEGFRVLTAHDLPRPDQRHHDHLVDELVDRQRRWESVVGEVATEVANLRRRVDATSAAARIGREELELALERRVGFEDERATAELRPAAINDELARVAAASAEVSARAREAVGVEAALLSRLSSAGPEVAHLRMGDALSEQLDLLGTGERLGLVQPATAAAVARWLQQVQKGTADPDPVVAEMLEEVRGLEQRWEQISAVGVEDDPAVVEARERHEMLRARRNALEELSASGILADRARSEIDAAHAERLHVEEERHGRGGGLEQAIANEHAVCGRYGFGSYLDYTIALSTRSVGDAVQASLDRVRAEAVGASDALEAVREDAAASRHVLTQQRADARERLQAQFGAEAESLSVEVLQRIPARPVELDGIEAQSRAGVAALRAEESRLAEAAEALHDEQAGHEARIAELDQLMAEQSATADALAPLVYSAESQFAAAEAELAEARAREQAASVELAACAEQVSGLTTSTPEGYSAADIPMVINHMTPLVDPPEPDPVPVLMIDTFAPLGEHRTAALEATLVAAVRVQIVYLTDDPGIIAWADQLQPSAGQVIHLQRPGWFQRHLARRPGRPGEVHQRQ